MCSCSCSAFGAQHTTLSELCGWRYCSLHFSLQYGAGDVPCTPRLHPWSWAEIVSEAAPAAPLRPFAAHAQPVQPPFSRQVHLDAAVGNTRPAFVAQALPARQGMSAPAPPGAGTVPMPVPLAGVSPASHALPRPFTTTAANASCVPEESIPLPPSAAAAASSGVTASTTRGATPSTPAMHAPAAQSKRQRRTGNDADIPEGTLRSPATATADCDLTNVPMGFPKGPIPGDKDKLKGRVNNYTSDPRTGDGGFGVCRTRQPAKSKNKGDTLYLECYMHKRQGCMWRTRWENTTQGWVLLNYLPHCFPATDAEGNVLKHMPSVPAENGHSHDLIFDEARVCFYISNDFICCLRPC